MKVEKENIPTTNDASWVEYLDIDSGTMAISLNPKAPADIQEKYKEYVLERKK